MSYSALLKPNKIPVAKSYFPYEWFGHSSKLGIPYLPPYETFYSEFKRNVLEVRDDDDDDDDDDNNDNIGDVEQYQELQNIWQEQHMTTFCCDLLKYHNNLDMRLFVHAVEKMQQFYFNHHINLFKVAVSVLGITRWWLFQTANNTKNNFALIHPQNDAHTTLSSRTLSEHPASFI